MCDCTNRTDVEICHWKNYDHPCQHTIVRLVDHCPFSLHFRCKEEIKINDHFILKTTIVGGPPHNGLYRVTKVVEGPGCFVVGAEFVCMAPDICDSRPSALEDAQLIQRTILA